MKLSEAIALGRNNVKLNSACWLSWDQDCGCLLGIGFSATANSGKFNGKKHIGTAELAAVWPWIHELRPMPDNLMPRFTGFGSCKAIDIISQLSASVEKGSITFDQAIDWIRENEPQETAEEKREMVETFCEQLVSQ